MADRIIANTARALIGLDNFHYSVVVEDSETTLVYGEMVSVPETIELNVNTNSQASTLFADNKPAIAYSTVGIVEVSMVKATLPNEFLAEILGSKMVGGVRHISNTQSSPYVGIAWRQMYSDGSYAYVKLYKGKFAEPENNAKSKEDGIEFQTRTITGNFVATAYKMTADDASKFSLLMSTTDETDPEYTNEGDTWFDAMLAPIAAWATATDYVVGDLVVQAGNIYECLEAHEAGTFATDLAALKWRLVGAY